MLYTSSPNRTTPLEGGAGEAVVENKELFDRAKRVHHSFRDDPEVRAVAFGKALPYSGNDPDKLLEKTKSIIIEDLKEQFGERFATNITKALTREHAEEYLKNHTAQQATRRQATIESAFHEEKGSLAATLKRARLRDRGITLEDIRTWRRENMNMERRPSKFNSWVGNEAREEYQADLFFFEDLKEREGKEGAARVAAVGGRRSPRSSTRDCWSWTASARGWPWSP